MYHIFKLMNSRNRAYVIDLRGNKLYFGTVYQCRRFIEYMLKEGNENEPGKAYKIDKRKVGV